MAEVGVFGKKDPIVQELLTAAVVKKNDAQVTEQEIEKWVEDRLDDSKRLRGGVIFVQELPRNPIGKITRRSLLDFVKK